LVIYKKSAAEPSRKRLVINIRRRRLKNAKGSEIVAKTKGAMKAPGIMVAGPGFEPGTSRL
jgi:hypothetical protein